MALPERRSTGRALTASAVKLTARETSYSKRLSQPWQQRALAYYDTIGEINFTSKFLARQISRVVFFPAKRNDDQTLERITSGTPVDLMNQLQDPGGGCSQYQFDYGRLQFITGEGVLFGYEDGTKWKFLWKDEVKPLGGGQYVRLTFEQQETDEVGVGYRFWTPHPRWSDQADAPMRAVQDICEELLILTLGVRSTALTRLTNGIITLPTQLSPNPLSAGMDEDPEQNPLLSDWIEHVSAQIDNPGSVEARIPFLLEGDYEYLDKLKWVKTHDPATDYMERDLRKEAIERLALSLDMSPEDLLGYTNANHWTGRQVQLDRWRMFGFNKAEQFATALADAYLRPALRDDGYADWQGVVIGFDDSQVVISPDRTEDALKANAAGLLSGEATRVALGWTEKDRMQGEEKDEWLAIKLRDPQIIGEPATARVTETGPVPNPARGPMPATNNGRNPADGPPPPGTNSGVSRRESVSASLVSGAASMALHRCRELAGVRIQLKCKECGNGSEKSLVAAAVGPEVAKDPSALVRDGAEGFRGLLVGWGVAAEQALALQRMLEVYAARTLFENSLPDLPAGFVAAIEKVKEVSDALEPQPA
jgi:hypothetical protein